MSKDSTPWKPNYRMWASRWAEDRPQQPGAVAQLAESEAPPTSDPSHNSAPDTWWIQNPFDDLPTFSDETITLQIGPDSSRRSVIVHRHVLGSTTRFFDATQSLCISIPEDLTDDYPVVCDMFVNWLDHQEDPRPYIPLQYSEEPWRSYAAPAWIFARKICAPSFERYALAQFVTNCAVTDFKTWEFVESRAQNKSSLRRFTNHWVAWNCYLAGPAQSMYGELSAAQLSSVVGRNTNDPRVFDLDHWYSACGDNINATCVHDPVVRENAVGKLFSSRKARPEWGRDWETKNMPSQKPSASALSPTSQGTASTTNTKPYKPAVPPRMKKPTAPSLSPPPTKSNETTIKQSRPPLPSRTRRVSSSTSSISSLSDTNTSIRPIKPARPMRAHPPRYSSLSPATAAGTQMKPSKPSVPARLTHARSTSLSHTKATGVTSKPYMPPLPPRKRRDT